MPVLSPKAIGPAVFSYRIVSDEFDPCSPLSWVVLGGHAVSKGQDGKAIADTDREGVVWFRYGTPVNDPHPILLPRVGGVTRLDNHSARVTYFVTDEDPEAATTSEAPDAEEASSAETPTASMPAPEGFTAADVKFTTAFAPGDRVTIENNDLPRRANYQAVQIDVGQFLTGTTGQPSGS
ncbi:hypothetical protein CAQU_00715 [Corynebacterium aquilae DSM 44791]|uniref:Uncharacterized protein n=1 Tax=Corynebacterium aquilae DSM 44791 TaxID=1431546 RepID=A0A1L7CDD5_9CORY|nr:hypothetical protein CAQU_00715 [Corynebacterium aquilae DSM 44791]